MSKIRKLVLIGLFNIKKVGRFFILLLLLLSISFLFTILFDDFEIVEKVVRIVLNIEVSSLAILLSL